MNRITALLTLTVLVLSGGQAMSDYEAAYPRTPVGTIEIKNLPAATVIAAGSPGDAFQERDGNFMKLFRYINANEIKMTVPVEAESQKSRMRFFVGKKDAQRELKSSAEVMVETIPARTVASFGQRGSYTNKRFLDGVSKLEAWLKQHPEWVKAGEPYGVYWNSPFTLWFLKRSEVHIPVKHRGEAATK